MADTAGEATAAPRRGGRGRRALARALVVLGASLIVVSAHANFVRYEALDTGQFRETSRLLIADEEIQAQVAATLVEALYESVDVTAELEDQLPDDLQGLAGPIAGLSRELADRAARELVARPAAQTAWVEATVLAQRELSTVLAGETTRIGTAGGDVTLDLRPLITRLGDRLSLVSDLGDRLPEDAGTIVILQSDELKTAQDVTQALKVVARWIWILALAAWAGALWLAQGRRRAELRAIAIAAVITGFLLLVIRALAGRYVVDSLVSSESVEPAAQEAWDIVTRLLEGSGWSLVLVGIVTLAGVWLAGPSGLSRGLRLALAPWLRRPELAFGGAGALYLLLLLWQPTPQFGRLLWVIVAAVLAGVGTELLRRQVAREHPDAVAVDWIGVARERYDDRQPERRGGAPEAGHAAELERLAALHARGVLTDAEFAAAKAALLVPPAE